MAIPTDPETLLTRVAGAEALTEAGYPTAPATLATRASRGGSPPYRRYGSRVIYRWGELLAWAEARLSPPMCSTSEADAGRPRRSADFRTATTSSDGGIGPGGRAPIPRPPARGKRASARPPRVPPARAPFRGSDQ
jgi:hypothetical protein